MKTNYRPHNGLLEMLGINKQTEYPKSTLPIRDIDESRYLWEEDGMTVVVRDKTIECGGNFMRFATIDLFDLRKLRMVFCRRRMEKDRKQIRWSENGQRKN
jgi:hypothetical protein